MNTAANSLKTRMKERNWLNAQHVRIRILVLPFLATCNVISQQDLVSTEVYAIDWYVFTRRDLNAMDLINWSNEPKKHYSIKDKSDLSMISERLNGLKPLPDFRDVDTRMVCILHYSSGDIDTLQFGSTKILKYKDVIFDKDSVLLSTIEKWRP